MKIVVLTAIWQRHELFKIFMDGFERAKQNTDHELILVTVGSENIEFSDNHVESANQPLSDKWQNGMNKVKSLNPDYVLMLGSDDVICSNLLDVYTPEMEKGIDLIGLIDCYFLDARINTLYHWIGYTNHRRNESIGMARMISKRLLNRIDWNIWDKGLRKGLDASMMRNFKRVEYSEKMFNCIDENIAAIDIKTDLNVSNIKDYRDLRKISFNNLSKFVSEKEFYSILKL